MPLRISSGDERPADAPRWLHRLGPLLAVALFGVALWAIHRELHGYRYHDVRAAIASLPSSRLALATLFTGCSYLVLTGYDALGVRYVGRHPGYGTVAVTSFVSYSFSHNVGFAVLSSTPLRYRFYAASGFSSLDVAKVAAICGLTFWLGFCAVGGVVFLVDPPTVPAGSLLPSARLLGALLLLLLAGYLLVTARHRRPFRWGEAEFPVPRPGFTLLQIAVSAADWTLAAAVLFVLLPRGAGISFPQFFGIYLLAQLAGMASQVPGGLGVFESVVLLLLPSAVSGPQALATVLVFRAVYYLLPLTAAALLMAGFEIAQRRAHLRRAAAFLQAGGAAALPNLLALGTFAGGAVLLFSGATPAVHARLTWLGRFVPLFLLEASHLLASVVGASLLIVARGLQRRLDGAYQLTAVLLTLGAAASILKGLDYEEALFLVLLLLALLPARQQFYRRSSLAGEPFTTAWVGSIVVILGATGWLGWFSYHHVEYRDELWWHFALRGEASRFLRASVAAAALALLFALTKLVRPSAPRGRETTGDALARVETVVAGSEDSGANLAFLGDKQFLFNDSGRAFVMYAIEGRSWIAMGDPVGPVEERIEAAWRFRDLVDRHDGWPVFYQVAPDSLPLYVDLGLNLVKIGERALVPLETFSLEGSARKDLRSAVRKGERAGWSFQVLAPEDLPGVLDRLREISDEWLRERRTREKGFSLGRFEPAYLLRFPHAVVRCDDRVVAFSNIWTSAGREEISIDLMRQASEAPAGVMDYLLVALLRWAREQGYRRFDLGMAPLSGLADEPLAPLWSRIGARLYRGGEEFYHFQGLRRFKEKFDPVWEPRYLASPGGRALPRVLTNVAALVSGGVRGIVAH